MKALNTRLFAVTGIVALTGCAADHVVFVTKTSIGIDADTTPPSVSIAYDRTDGYFGPRYDNGAIPPVVSSIKSDLKVFEPKVQQVYATGEAAMLVTNPDAENETVKRLELTGEKKRMFFGTTTTVGVKLGFDANGVPESILFGYKRKEASVIPLGTTKKTVNGMQVSIDTYPSVIASIDMRVQTPSLRDTSLQLSQFFATGNAANALAQSNPNIRAAFQTLAEEATNAVTPGVIVGEDLQKRRVAMTRFVTELVNKGDRTSLDAFSKTLKVPTDPQLAVQGANIRREIFRRATSPDSMDRLSTDLASTTMRTF